MQTTKVQNHPVHVRSSTFVLGFLKSIISTLAACKISRFKLVSVTEQAGLSFTWSQTLKTGFPMLRPKLYIYIYI